MLDFIWSRQEKCLIYRLPKLMLSSVKFNGSKKITTSYVSKRRVCILFYSWILVTFENIQFCVIFCRKVSIALPPSSPDISAGCWMSYSKGRLESRQTHRLLTIDHRYQSDIMRVNLFNVHNAPTESMMDNRWLFKTSSKMAARFLRKDAAMAVWECWTVFD